MSRLIVLARYWNDMDWLEASLEHIRYWNPDYTIISEGNWDQDFPQYSVDGTRERVESFVEDIDGCLIDNIRTDTNYRKNQAATSNKAMTLAKAEVGDWVIVIDCDMFFFKEDIDSYKRMMVESTFIYPVFHTYAFLTDLNCCQIVKDNCGVKLPYKLVKGYRWIPTNHLRAGSIYHRAGLKRLDSEIKGYHYEGMRSATRLKDKYDIGDRKTPESIGRLNNLVPFKGSHPDFVMEVLSEYS